MLTNAEFYRDLGPDYHRPSRPERAVLRKIKDLEAARHTITKAA
jgi:hypothetical protein